MSAFTGDKHRFSAGKISNENWCGSCRVNAYWSHPTLGSGALALTNRHVATGRVGDRMEIDFALPDGGSKRFTAVNLINAYSTTKAIDWALVFVVGLTADSGIEPVKVSRTGPIEQREFQLSGSPKCVFPPITYQARFVDVIHDHVVRYSPISVGGSSGSGLIDDRGIMVILNAWSWGRYGAGMSTGAIHGQMKRGVAGWEESLRLAPDRDPHMIELGAEWENRPAAEEGFFNVSEWAPSPVVNIRDYPIWEPLEGGPDDPSEPDDPCDPSDPPKDDPEEPADPSLFDQFSSELDGLVDKYRDRFAGKDSDSGSHDDSGQYFGL